MYEESPYFDSRDLGMIRDLGEGFLEKYVAYAKQLTDAPTIYHYGCAFAVLSTVVGPFVHEPLLKSKANLWILLLGPTTIYRKTTCLNIARMLLLEVDEELIIAADFSPQGLLAEFAEANGRAGMLLKDEASGLFHSIRRQDFMSGTKEWLIKLYDGESFYRRLRKERYGVKNPYFVWLGGAVTTKLMEALTEEDIYSGLMVRFILIQPENRGPYKPLQYETATMDWEKIELLKRLSAIEERIALNWTMNVGSSFLSGRNDLTFVLRSRALKRFNHFVHRLEREGEGDPIAERINSRTGPLALKLMMLFGCDHWVQVRRASNTVLVDLPILVKSLYWADLFRHYNLSILTDVGTSRRERLWGRILDHVKASPGTSRGELMRRFKLSSADMNTMRDSLVDRGVIRVEIRIDGSKRGRNPELYYPVEGKES